MKKLNVNKKYLLAVAAGLLTTAAVTATVLSTTKPVAKKAVKETKCTRSAACNKAIHTCMFN